MISETEKLAIEVEDMPFKGWSTDVGTRVAAELRRLAVIEQELETLKKTLSEAEPFGCVTVVRRLGHTDEHNFYKYPSLPYLDNASECHALYTLKGIK